MGVIEDIKKMKSEGRSESDITTDLMNRGLSEEEINQLIEQARIKEAVSPTNTMEEQIEETGIPMPTPAGFSPSIMSETEQTAQESEETNFPSLQREYSPSNAPAQPAYNPPQQQNFYTPPEYSQQYAQYPQEEAFTGFSPDTITEISEQLISEKLSPIRNKFEKIIDMKTTFEAKMENLNERLIRIEKIIDRLQLSVLQKVGDYITDVSDLKRELIETQKSFKFMQDSHKSKK